MDRNLHIKWILDDRKERHFVDCTNQDLVNKIPKLIDEDFSFEKDQLLEDSLYCLSREDFSLVKEYLELLLSLPLYIFSMFLQKYKGYHYGNMYENREETIADFHKVNIPLIRMLDYFIEKRAFGHFDLVAERLENELLVLWFELSFERINEIIEENIHNPNLLFIFARIGYENFERFFKKEYLCIIQNAPFEAFETILSNGVVSEEYIDNDFFLNAFKSYRLSEQIVLTELLEDCDFNYEFILKLHKFFNKDGKIKENNFNINVFEMSSEKLEIVTEMIRNSSYFTKNGVKDSKLWKLLTSGYDSTIDLTVDYYSQIMDLYYMCREYSTKSIVNSLYPLNILSKRVNRITGEFNILARVRTMWETVDLDETFRKRTFCSFSVLTEKNMSHYGNSVLYGYYTGVTPDLIAHIYPMDSLSNAEAKFESQLTNRMNRLLDIDDLNEATLEHRTYNQLCIRTKSKEGKILQPDCIVCINEVDLSSKQIADEMNLSIIVLNKTPDTIENNVDIFNDLQ